MLSRTHDGDVGASLSWRGWLRCCTSRRPRWRGRANANLPPGCIHPRGMSMRKSCVSIGAAKKTRGVDEDAATT
ncbi:hypothetical protein K438DRAFT_192013 [Mycena galopus ATCC 62051]|nr:hypothetical protein K438DRAFT_192013 [Mycena galopus ATCC 62051]